MSNSSGMHALSSCTVHVVNVGAVALTEWMVTGVDVADKSLDDEGVAGAERHELAK